MTPLQTIGVTGTAVEDTIDMPDGTRTEDRGGIHYAVHALAALAPSGTTIVPILGVGEDFEASAREDFAALPGVVLDGLVSVAAVNNKVHIRYGEDGSRTETLTGGVPPLGWEAFEPWIGRLDGWLWNLISGMEVERETFLEIKSAFAGPIHLDLHSLCLEHHPGHVRFHRAPPHWEEWVAGTTWVQMNEIEAGLLWDGTARPIDPHDEPELAARIHALGPEGLLVTRGEEGAAYYGADGERLRLWPDPPEPPVDPTGCGDVFGAAWFALRGVRGLSPREAFAGAVRAAAVAATVRGTRDLHVRLREARIVDPVPAREAADGR